MTRRKKEVVRTWRTCIQCKQSKLMAHRSIRCKDCLKDNRDKRFVDKKNKIADNPENRMYLLSLPIARKVDTPLDMLYGDNEIRTFAVYVYPFRFYDGIKGTELIRLYLNPKDGKRYGKTQATLQYEYRYRRRYGNLTVADIERLTKLGNVWNDTGFEWFKEECAKRTGKELESFINSCKALTDAKFTSVNEGLGIRYKEEAEKIKAEQRKQQKEEAEDEGNMQYDDMDDDNE